MDTIESIVRDRLKHYEIGNFDDLRPLVKKQFLEIEEYISNAFKTRRDAIKTFKDNNVSIFDMSNKTSVSKATIYNNSNTLKKYIEERIKELELLEKGFYDKDKIETYEKTIQEQKMLIDKTSTQFVELNNLKILVEEVNEELKMKEKNIQDLYQTNISLQKELQNIRKELSKNNVIKLNQKG